LRGQMLAEPFELDRLEEAAASILGPAKRTSGAIVLQA
jgi:hypothetical protein